MRLYENEAKKVFQTEGIPVPRQLGLICKADQLKGKRDLTFPMMLKSLVLIGGRGKAGGIKKAGSKEEAVRLEGRAIRCDAHGSLGGRAFTLRAYVPRRCS